MDSLQCYKLLPAFKVYFFVSIYVSVNDFKIVEQVILI